MTEHHPDDSTPLVDDLIDESRGPEEDPPQGGTTDDAAENVPPTDVQPDTAAPEPPD